MTTTASRLTKSTIGNGSVEQLTQRNIEVVRKLEEAANEERTTSDRVARMVARFCGSMTFVWVHVICFAGWIALNLFPGVKHIDPFPFTFMTFVVSLEAIFLSTFILISQNQDTRISERRNHLDLQINLLAEEEMTKVLQSLDLIGKRLGIDDLLGSIDADDLAKDTSVEHVAMAVTEQEKK